MTLIGLAMNVLLAALLMAALAMGVRLNRRLTALRDSHEGFAVAVGDLNAAAARAEQGLADLRAATDEATDVLCDRLEKGRALAAKLERLVNAAPAVAPAPPEARPALRAVSTPSVTPPLRADTAEQRLGELLAAAREARTRPERPASRPPLTARPSASALDDDLFEDAPLSLDRLAGARR
jgi:hypothetical protein